MAFSFFGGDIVDFLHSINGDKGGGIRLLHEFHDRRILALVHDHLQLQPPGHVAIGTDGLINRRAGVKGIDDKIPHLLKMGRDNAQLLFSIHAKDKFVQHHAIEIGAHQGNDHRPAVIAQCGQQ